jgi:hypothetical protein
MRYLHHGAPVGSPANNEENVMATTMTRWTLVMAMALAASHAAAQQDVRLETLERAFWRCDYEATQGRLDRAAAMECSVATEALKARKFGGDFGAMLAWWREHKPAAHLALAGEAAQRVATQRP